MFLHYVCSIEVDLIRGGLCAIATHNHRSINATHLSASLSTPPVQQFAPIIFA
jgi:hypothetical protein